MLGTASSLLTLPRFHPALPTSPTIDEGQGGVKTFAASLIHAGVLRENHLDSHPRNLRLAIEAAVQQWLAPYHSQFELFRTVAFGYTPTLRFEDHGEFGPDIRATKPAAFCVSNDDVPREARYIGPFATTLQQKHPGLGRDLMHLLHVASTHGIGLFDPHTAYGEAQTDFWMGNLDIGDVADGYRDYDREEELKKRGEPIPTDEQILEENDIPTPKQFFLEYPEWAVTFPGSCGYQPGRLPSFPRLTGKYRRVMAAATDLADHLRFVRRRWLRVTRDKWECIPNDAHRINPIATHCAHPILLRWSSEDWHIRLLDDAFDVVMQEGIADYHLTGVVCFDPLDDADCRDARLRFEALLTTGILTDRLLRLTTTGDKD